MMPWCAKMKQLIEERNVDEPPKPDFSRSLPPLLMDTMDTCNVSETHGERFTVWRWFTLLRSAVACGVYIHVFAPSRVASHSRAPQRFDDTSNDESDSPEEAAAAQVQGGSQ
jgi:hypothetical protein